MIIADNRYQAAGLYSYRLPKTLICRKIWDLTPSFRLGMSLETDALVIIVSEERGKISVAHNGKIEVNVTAEEFATKSCQGRRK